MNMHLPIGSPTDCRAERVRFRNEHAHNRIKGGRAGPREWPGLRAKANLASRPDRENQLRRGLGAHRVGARGPTGKAQAIIAPTQRDEPHTPALTRAHCNDHPRQSTDAGGILKTDTGCSLKPGLSRTSPSLNLVSARLRRHPSATTWLQS